MTAPRAGRRRLPIAELYVLLCTGLAVLMALEVVGPPWGMVALLLLLLPAGFVVLVLALNVVVLLEASLDSAAGQVAFVLFVTVLALLQAWMFRTMARNWRRTPVEMRPAPVTAGPDTGR